MKCYCLICVYLFVFYNDRYKLINGTDMTGGLNIESVGYIYENIPKSIFKNINYPIEGVPSPTMPGIFIIFYN